MNIPAPPTHCGQCGAEYRNIQHPMRPPGVTIQRLCDCTATTKTVNGVTTTVLVPPKIPTCEHRWPYPAGWNRALDSERRAQWPAYCTPCPKCQLMTTKPSTRPETGTMKFGDDWTGVFIRGDDAFGYANALSQVLLALPERSIAASTLTSLLTLLRSSNEQYNLRASTEEPKPATQVLLPFPECREAGPIEVAKDLLALIQWRDSLALDWTGEDLVFHILRSLAEWRPGSPPDVPEEHRAALKTFQALSEDEQYEMVKAALIICESY